MADAGVVRVGLIGCGGISGAHGNGFIRHKDKIRVAAVCDIADEAIKRRTDQLSQTQHPTPKAFKDWKVMLKEMGGELDAIDICLPHHLHAPAILDALAAGKSVLCEKPMCMTLAEADSILSAVRASGKTYMSAHNQLFMPCVREARKRLDDGLLGRVMYVRSVDCFRANGEGFRGTWRSKLATQGGGELIDTGYHPTYRMLHLGGQGGGGQGGAIGRVTAVRGTMARFAMPIEGEDSAAVQVRFDHGAIGEILTSWAMNVPAGMWQIHVVGEKGQLFGSENELHYLPAGATTAATYKLPGVDTFVEEIAHFAECVRDGKKPMHGPEEGKAVLEVILKATESAAGW